MRPLKVLVVDDSAFSRQTIKRILEEKAGVQVVGIATDGIDAISKTLRLRPDLITLDLEMPEMDGFSFLRWLMRERPTPVLMVSSYADTKTVFRALELGAVDFIAKPTRRASAELRSIERDLLEKVEAARRLNLDVLSRNLRLLSSPGPALAAPRGAARDVEAVVIGASTGGPQALQIILTKLPEDYPAAVLVSQHMPKGFTGPLAERLNRMAKVHIKEAQDGDPVVPGRVLICPGGSHMLLRRRGSKVRVALREPGPKDKYVPSVDALMRSAAELYGRRAVGVLLTGMGSDGRQGMLEIKARGGYTIAESEQSAVVFGMPQEAINAGAAAAVLALPDIPAELLRVARGGMEGWNGTPA